MIHVYTDGACKVNPGKGGWGAVIVSNGVEYEFRGGCYEMTTNNRMEILAVIEGLKKINDLALAGDVIAFSDSKYVVNGISKGWARAWQAKGWIKPDKKKAKNIDLWKQLLALCDIYQPTFQWVKGHDGNKYNERCDALSNQGIEEMTLIQDDAYEPDEPEGEQLSLF